MIIPFTLIQILKKINTFKKEILNFEIKFLEDKSQEEFFNGPNGIRTRVFGVRGRCPRPLDDGTSNYEFKIF